MNLQLEDCHALLIKHLESREFYIVDYEETPSTGQYLKIKIRFVCENKVSEVNFLVKKQERSHEAFAYEFFSKHYEDNSFAPKYYFGKVGKFIVIEDVFEQGYSIPNNLDLVHLKLALKTLAKFHSGGIALKREEKFENSRNGVLASDSFKELLEKVGDISLQLEKIYRSKLCKARRQFCNILCHEFIWAGNMLFKYNSEKVPIDCKLVNFELLGYHPPALNVLQLIYMSTSTEIRKHHLHDLLDYYYDCLKINMEKNDNFKIGPEDFHVSVHELLALAKIQTACIKENNSDQKETIEEFKSLAALPQVSLEDCFKIVKSKLGTSNYELLNFQVTPFEGVCGFLGSHNKLKIDILLDNREVTTIDLFAKFQPKSEAAAGMAMDTGAFKIEVFFYNELASLFKEYNVDSFQECVVPCYLARDNDIIILENFALKDYKTFEGRQPLCYEVVEMIIKQLAKFHSSTVVLEERIREKSKSDFNLKERYPNYLEETFFIKSETHRGGLCIQAGINAIEHMLQLFPSVESDEELKIKIRKAYKEMYNLIQTSSRFRNVVGHSDLWTSNVLIQGTKENPIDCRFIDFQFCRYCPPTQDLLTFIYLTTTRKFRMQHFEKIINVYYDAFGDNLTRYDLNQEELFPYDEYLESVEYMIPEAVCQTAVYFQLCLTNPDIVREYMGNDEDARTILIGDRRDFIADMVKRDPLYRGRVEESLQDLREMCLKYF